MTNEPKTQRKTLGITRETMAQRLGFTVRCVDAIEAADPNQLGAELTGRYRAALAEGTPCAAND